jgi:hypothetical protein
MRARTPGTAGPLLRAITDFEGTEQAIAVHGRWAALNARLSDEITAVVKTSVMSDKEQANWVSYQEWCAAEERLARDEYGSQRRLLVALSCRIPPCRGGDLGLVHIVSPDFPTAGDNHTNVMVWGGNASQPSAVLLKRHKTWRLKGALTKPLPPSARAIVEASLTSLPRPTLFVSDFTRQPYKSEASFLTWACRAFHGIFGKHVTMNGARHVFVSALDTSRVSTTALEQLATEMGHSTAAQKAYFRLVDGPAAIRTEEGELSLPLLHTAGHRIGQVRLGSA